jgi:hypothetical protein
MPQYIHENNSRVSALKCIIIADNIEDKFGNFYFFLKLSLIRFRNKFEHKNVYCNEFRQNAY